MNHTVNMLDFCGLLMTCMVKMLELPGSFCEPHSQSAGTIGICYDMHGQNAGKFFFFFFMTCA